MIKQRFSLLSGSLDERMRRLVAAAEAKVAGYGGVSLVARATGVSRRAITVGLEELKHPAPQPEISATTARVRKTGGGRKKATAQDVTLLRDLERLIEPLTRGDPESPLRWTCKSLRRLAAELVADGHEVSHRLVGELLEELGYSLQANRKTQEGSAHPDRDAQFLFINRRTQEELALGNPVISVDTKKKELVGDFKNGGKEWRPKGKPQEVRVYDFIDKAPDKGRVTPYGVYDLTANEGWVSVGTDHDTARFAAQTINKWWREMGSARYPQATELLITADGGGSNSSRCRLWKIALQELANATGLVLHVSHFPPGTSKWNKIEHRLFCHVTQNWRGEPLVSHDLVVKLIASTTTDTGLKVRAALDTTRYQSGIKVTDRELGTVRIQRDAFHGEWNYSILPQGTIG